MKCPYCASDISDEALACPHCARDLYLFKPLLEKIETLEKKVRELEARGTSAAAAELAREPEPELPQTPIQQTTALLLLWLSPLVLLLIAHLLITIVYDFNTLYLRAISLLIPLPFGIVLMARRRRHFVFWTAMAFVMAILAVLGMSWATHLVDQTPVLPQDRLEVKEFIEYAASISFSYMTGMVLGRMFWLRRQRALRIVHTRGLAVNLAKMISGGKESADKIQDTVKKIQEFGGSLAAVGTSLAAAYTGLQNFLGGG